MVKYVVCLLIVALVQIHTTVYAAYITMKTRTIHQNFLSKEILDSLNGKLVTLAGFGSLLSETSSRTTFPHLQNFRLGRIEGLRRVFRHPAAIFYERGIALHETLEISSLSVEHSPEHGFICSLFDVPNFNVKDFVDREEEFEFGLIEYSELGETGSRGQGLICLASTDENVEERWGEGYIKDRYGRHGIETIWGWRHDSGILPCPVYLKHCVLASRKHGDEAHASFLKETFLADRVTTIEEHLKDNPHIMEMEAPPSVANRYTG